jgi:fatty-acyl-CoA synthase
MGGVYSPINFRLTKAEILQLATFAEPTAYVADLAYRDLVREVVREVPSIRHVIWTGGDGAFSDNEHGYDRLVARYGGRPFRAVEVDADEAWRIAFTSGTTGLPKGVNNSHAQTNFTLLNRLADVMPGVDETHAHLAIGPVSHGTGTVVLINTLKGARTVMLSSAHFDEAEALRLIESERITSLFTVPSILTRLLRHPDFERTDRSSLRHVVYAGAVIPRPDQIEAIEKLGTVLVQYYGSGEILGGGTVLPPRLHRIVDGEPLCPQGAVGYPRSGCEFSLMDESFVPVPDGEAGEICIRGPGVFPGYYRNDEENARIFRDGWFRTGDLGRMDDRGLVYIVGRIKEIYKSGGLQVSPNEIQELLAKHPGVEEAHVVPVPDSRWGEIGIAIVKPAAAVKVTEQELLAHLRSSLAGFKIPRRVFFWNEIPRSAVGKPSRALLTEGLKARGALVEGQDVAPPREETAT